MARAPLSMPSELPRLVVFADDWGRHPSSMQHLARELLARWRVDWVNTVGTRRPGLRAADVKRAIEKLRAWTQPRAEPDALPASLRVHSPVHWPGFSAGWERRLNARLLERALRPVIAGAEAVVATAPIVADLAARIPDANWVYYCVDDLAEWPGLDREALVALERDFVPRARRIVVVSEHLRARMRGLGRGSELLTHGIDPQHWRGIAARGARAPGARPRAAFWGAIDRRLDTDIVLRLAQDADVELVGPEQDPDPRVLAAARVHRRGPVPYADLPAVAREADVLVMPYADLPVTRAMQPLKLKEYLATGLPVVATPLPANREWEGALDLEADPARFAARVVERSRAALPAGQRLARERLAGESWSAKALLFERWIRRS